MSNAIPKGCIALLKEASEMFEETGCVPGIDGEEDVPSLRTRSRCGGTGDQDALICKVGADIIK
jgi:hypothetical protein